jgi:hypothetical protein
MVAANANTGSRAGQRDPRLGCQRMPGIAIAG